VTNKTLIIIGLAWFLADAIVLVWLVAGGAVDHRRQQKILKLARASEYERRIDDIVNRRRSNGDKGLANEEARYEIPRQGARPNHDDSTAGTARQAGAGEAAAEADAV
jgi:hypothetical protein